MFWLFTIWLFVSLFLLSISKNSLLNREFHIYNTVIKHPYLKRIFIKDSYYTFE